jgi:hypothetical protein
MPDEPIIKLVASEKVADTTISPDKSLLPISLSLKKEPNNHCLPDNLKAGIENLSGYNLSDLSVHYNSPKPAQLHAHAYAQGTDKHIDPGQERHLPHEAWHVVQQKQGRVKPTLQMKSGVAINDNHGLEAEADVMGARALQLGAHKMKRSVVPAGFVPIGLTPKNSFNGVMQMVLLSWMKKKLFSIDNYVVPVGQNSARFTADHLEHQPKLQNYHDVTVEDLELKKVKK